MLKGGHSIIIKGVTTNLAFFVLALLIIEGFIVLVVKFSVFDNTQKFQAMCLGIILFFIELIIVSIIVWFKPENLLYNIEGMLRERGKPPFGTNKGKITNDDYENLETKP